MQFAITLVDINPRLISAWQEAFGDRPEVRVVCDSILRQPADAWVTPTNARGMMDGGVDAVMKRYLGHAVQARVQREIRVSFGGSLPVGGAVCVSTEGLHAPVGAEKPRYLISAATMAAPSQDVSGTCNAACAFAAALLAAQARSAFDGDVPVRSLAVPGLGTSTGRLGANESARQMRAAYDLVCERGACEPGDVDSLRLELSDRLAASRAVPVSKPRKRRFLRIF